MIPPAMSQDIHITSSHLAQFIYPDETLTLTLTASSEMLEDGVIVRILDVNNEVVSARTLEPTVPGVIVDEISDLPLGAYAYHVQSTNQPINDSTLLAWTRLVIAPEPDPTIDPDDSPIAVDAWLAWRFPGDEESMECAAHLMQRMGIRWVRDRLAWHQVQPERDVWDWSRYDNCYRIQAEAGLHVIPVFHDVARWASPTGDYEPAHRPTDLQDLVTFTREVAQHFGDTIAGVEIANEFNSPIFWRGSSDELAVYVKAAAAGLWQGNPGLIRLMGSSTDALDRLPGLADAQGAIDNNVLAWVDVVTPHHYGPPHGLTTHLNWYRQHAPEHPIWVTETGSTAIPEVGPYVSDEEREQAAYLVNAFESALNAGAERVFYFCLTDFYEEGQRPFGLVECRDDFWIPRPGLFELARLAATTRLDDDRRRMRDWTDRRIPRVLMEIKWPSPPFEQLQGVFRPGPDGRGPMLSGEGYFMLDYHFTAAISGVNHLSWQLDLSQWLHQPGSNLGLRLPTHYQLSGGHSVHHSDPSQWPDLYLPFREREGRGVARPDFYAASIWDQAGIYQTIVGEIQSTSVRDLFDRAVVDIPVTVPITLTRPNLLDALDVEPRSTVITINTSEHPRDVALTWGDGESPRFPFTVASAELTLAPRASAEIVFPAEPGAWDMDSRDEHMHDNTVRWVSGNDSATGTAIPEWNAIHQRGEREIALDGVLEDWMGVWDWRLDPTHTVVGPPGEDDATLRALWDEEALWIAAVIHDDNLHNPSPLEEPWTGDSFEIYLDINAPDEIGQMGYNGSVFQLQIVPALPEVLEGNVMFSRPEDISADDIGHAVRVNEHEGRCSMVHELRIPWGTLGLGGPPEGLQIGFEWAVNDLDVDGMSRSQMVWRGTVDNWRDPSHFSRIHLLD